MKRMFMPGCSLSAYSPALTVKAAEYLRSCFPDIAIVQRCCGKPTKLTGQNDLFRRRLRLLEGDIRECRAEQIISACPGCINTISDIDGIQAVSLWEILCETGLPVESVEKAKDRGAAFSVHDACASRENLKTHECVRQILKELGYAVAPSATEGMYTRCCGQGGMVGVTNSELSSAAARKCMEGFGTDNIVVYCSSCRGAFMSNGGKAWHILDLIWGDVVSEGDEPPHNILASPLKAWKNRLAAKKAIINNLGSSL